MKGERAQAATTGPLEDRQLEDVLIQMHGDVSPQLVREVVQELGTGDRCNEMRHWLVIREWIVLPLVPPPFWISIGCQSRVYRKQGVVQDLKQLQLLMVPLLKCHQDWQQCVHRYYMTGTMKGLLPRWHLCRCWQTRWSGSTPACAAWSAGAGGAHGWSPSGPSYVCGRESGASTCAGWWPSRYRRPGRAWALCERWRQTSWQEINGCIKNECI